MTRRPNVETFNKREQLNLSKEVKSTREKINEETEKMRDTRAKLFDTRTKGGFWKKRHNFLQFKNLRHNNQNHTILFFSLISDTLTCL